MRLRATALVLGGARSVLAGALGVPPATHPHGTIGGLEAFGAAAHHRGSLISTPGELLDHVFAYIDAGSGGLIIQALIAALVAAPFVFRQRFGRVVRQAHGADRSVPLAYDAPSRWCTDGRIP